MLTVKAASSESYYNQPGCKELHALSEMTYQKLHFVFEYNKTTHSFYLSIWLCTYLYMCMCVCTYVCTYCIRKAGKSAFWVPFL